jgi:hypothetical protein
LDDRATGLVIWVLWMAFVVAGLIPTAFVLTRIQTLHPDFYECLGRPLLLDSAFKARYWRFQSFLLFGRPTPPPDKILRLQMWLLRFFAAAAIVFLYLILSGQVHTWTAGS